MNRNNSIYFLSCLLLLAATASLRADDLSTRNGPQPLNNTLGPKVQITSYDHGEISTWAEFFIFDRPSHPKIQQLRSEYKLDDVVRDAKTDLDRAVGFRPDTPIETGLARFVQWYREYYKL